MVLVSERTQSVLFPTMKDKLIIWVFAFIRIYIFVFKAFQLKMRNINQPIHWLKTVFQFIESGRNALQQEFKHLDKFIPLIESQGYFTK